MKEEPANATKSYVISKSEPIVFIQAIHSLLFCFTQNGSKQAFLDSVVSLLQKESGCEYVGIRVLDEEGYIPYQSYVGFSQNFWESENHLKINGEDCSCTRLVRGALLPSDYAIISPSGSLCCNDLQHLGEALSPAEMALYRGACIREGFQSIAIVPIFNRGAIIGIVHIADQQPDKLTADALQCAETLAPILGEVLSRDNLERSLQSAQTNKTILTNIVSGISHLAYVANLTTWEVLHIRPDIRARLGFQQGTGTKCYELFGCGSPCAQCAQFESPTKLTWEHYNAFLDTHFLVERKAVLWPDGQLVDMAFVSDVTKQKVAEMSLLTSNDELRRNVQELETLSATLEEEIAERQDAQVRLEKQNQQIHYAAYHDYLTDLSNRAGFYQRLTDELHQRLHGAVIFIDLDDLKMVNDAFGHAYGDALIKTAGRCIVSAAGAQAFVARFGGDEFTVLLPQICEKTTLARVAETILTALAQTIEVYGKGFHLSGSMGIALYPEHGNEAEELLKNADNAMYAAKKSGKNCWRFYSWEMGAAVYENVVLNNQLRQAFDNNELILYYQPQVSLEEDTIVGFEALLRWPHPIQGFIPPSSFIPMAEQTGLIHPLGRWVLEQACAFLRALREDGKTNLHIAVNVSAYQLCSEDFVDMVQRVLTEQQVLPQQLELEITESVFISSMEESVAKLNRLKRMGVSISLDDFGTGFSSLTYLQRLPVQTLKLDHSFIDSLSDNEQHQQLIACIIEMAHILGMQVVGEGVETLEQMNNLRQYGCDVIQGYLISRPVPRSEALKLV